MVSIENVVIHKCFEQTKSQSGIVVLDSSFSEVKPENQKWH
jgi:hypothetical protein